MRVVQMDLDQENRVKRLKGSQHGKAGSKAGDDPGTSKKFAEVYEHTMAALQTPVSAGRTRQPVSQAPEQAIRSPGEGSLRLNAALAGPDREKRRVSGQPAKLWGAIGVQTTGTAKTGEKTREALQELRKAEPRGSEKAGRVFPHAAAGLTADEAYRPKSTVLQERKTAGRVFPHTAARPSAEETAGPRGTILQELKTAALKDRKRPGREMTHTAVKPSAEETAGPRDTALQELKTAEQQGRKKAGKVFPHIAARASDEADQPKGKDAAQRRAAEAKADGSANRSLFAETRQGTGHALTFTGTAGKNDSREAEGRPMKPEMKGGHGSETRDIPGGVTQLKPEVNKIKAPELTAADKNLMPKSQIDFIVAALMGQIKSGASGLEIDLKPEYLGRIKLLLDMRDGQVSVRIITRNPETMAIMNSSMPDIQERLEQQGIRLHNMSVDLAGQEKQGKQTGSGSREENRPANYFSGPQESHDNTGSWEQNYFQSGMLNILA